MPLSRVLYVLVCERMEEWGIAAQKRNQERTYGKNRAKKKKITLSLCIIYIAQVAWKIDILYCNYNNNKPIEGSMIKIFNKI